MFLLMREARPKDAKMLGLVNGEELRPLAGFAQRFKDSVVVRVQEARTRDVLLLDGWQLVPEPRKGSARPTASSDRDAAS